MCDVNIATGEVTQFEYEILLSGRIPWKLIRSYSSDHLQRGLIGFGWKLNLGTWLRNLGDHLELTVDGDHVATVPLPPHGYRIKDEASGLEVARSDAELTVTNPERTSYVFPNREALPSFVLASSVRDYYGNALQYAYDDEARLAILTDSMGRRLFFEYDRGGRLSRVAMPKTNPSTEYWPLIRYVYDDRGDLVAALDPIGHATRYEYVDHLLTRVTDRTGRELYYQYDRERRCVRTWFTGGVWDRQLRFDPRLRRVLVTDPLGHRTLYQTNEQGITIGEVDPLGRVRDSL